MFRDMFSLHSIKLGGQNVEMLVALSIISNGRIRHISPVLAHLHQFTFNFLSPYGLKDFVHCLVIQAAL
jgi:hypothetical protein